MAGACALLATALIAVPAQAQMEFSGEWTTVQDEDSRVMHVISKESPHSRKKIDAAAAGALSWEARGDAVADGATATSGYEDPRIMCRTCGHLRRHHVPECRARPPGHCLAYQEREI